MRATLESDTRPLPGGAIVVGETARHVFPLALEPHPEGSFGVLLSGGEDKLCVLEVSSSFGGSAQVRSQHRAASNRPQGIVAHPRR